MTCNDVEFEIDKDSLLKGADVGTSPVYGPQGPKGDKGEKGEKGDAGPQGPMGASSFEELTGEPYDNSELKKALDEKQDEISDLATIREGASAGATAVQPATMIESLAQKQNTIPDLEDIRKGSSYGATSIQGVKLNGVAVEQSDEHVINIPTGGEHLGVVKTSSVLGTAANSKGELFLIQAETSEVALKVQRYKPITPNVLDFAVKVGIVANKLQLEDSEKEAALNWLGAAPKRKLVKDLTTTVMVLANAEANTDYQYGTLTSLTVSANETSYLETNIFFTASSDGITVNLPDSLQVIGNITFLAGKSYVLSIMNNCLVMGEITQQTGD